MIKHLLRGFGIGVIFTAVVLALINKPKQITDEEIIKKAQCLGMVTAEEMDSKLKSERLDVIKEMEEKAAAEPVAETATTEKKEEPVTEPAEEPSDDQAEEPVEDQTEETSDEQIEEPADEQVEEPSDEQVEEPSDETVEEPTEEVSDQSSSDDEETYTLTIRRGMSSEKVSDALFNAGVVDSAKDLNSYLVKSGKSSFINVGVFEIPYDADYAEIADIITD